MNCIGLCLFYQIEMNCGSRIQHLNQGRTYGAHSVRFCLQFQRLHKNPSYGIPMADKRANKYVSNSQKKILNVTLYSKVKENNNSIDFVFFQRRSNFLTLNTDLDLTLNTELRRPHLLYLPARGLRDLLLGVRWSHCRRLATK